jgi:hypothetical protein
MRCHRRDALVLRADNSLFFRSWSEHIKTNNMMYAIVWCDVLNHLDDYNLSSLSRAATYSHYISTSAICDVMKSVSFIVSRGRDSRCM